MGPRAMTSVPVRAEVSAAPAWSAALRSVQPVWDQRCRWAGACRAQKTHMHGDAWGRAERAPTEALIGAFERLSDLNVLSHAWAGLTAVALGPLALFSISKSTAWPSFRVRKPSAWMAL